VCGGKGREERTWRWRSGKVMMIYQRWIRPGRERIYCHSGACPHGHCLDGDLYPLLIRFIADESLSTFLVVWRGKLELGAECEG
jgi:hypothetical protein